MRTLPLSLLALAALAACDSGVDRAEEPAGPTDQVAEPATPAPTTVPSELDAIPAAFQGRWGLVAADCEPGRSDAKGLLTITPEKLEFYESVGTLDEIQEAAPERIRASFDFTGEGMTWRRDETLAVEDGGRTLIRRESGDDAAPGPFRYGKCA